MKLIKSAAAGLAILVGVAFPLPAFSAGVIVMPGPVRVTPTSGPGRVTPIHGTGGVAPSSGQPRVISTGSPHAVPGPSSGGHGVTVARTVR